MGEGEIVVLTIGICDDNAEQVQLLMRYLNDYQGDDELQIVQSTKPEVFLAELQTNKPHLVFLDIDMGEMNGIQLGDSIKSLNEDTIIVYITAHEEYALEAFRVRAFHYLLKPLTKEKFYQAFEEAVRLILKDSRLKPAKALTVEAKGEIYCLDYNDICYFEKIGHQIKIHTQNRDIYYYDNLFNLLEQLDTHSFIRCHQGYIVNVDKIRGFRDKTLFLDENLQLPVSRSYIDKIKEILASRLFGGKDSQ